MYFRLEKHMALRKMRTRTKVISLVLLFIAGGTFLSTRNVHQYEFKKSLYSQSAATVTVRHSLTVSDRSQAEAQHPVILVNDQGTSSLVGDHKAIGRSAINDRNHYNNNYYYQRKKSNESVTMGRLANHQTTTVNTPANPLARMLLASYQTAPAVGTKAAVRKAKSVLRFDCKNPNTVRKLESEHVDVNRHRTGYILALTFREQQTKASDNLFSLQCWAKTLSVYVVEPFMKDSHLVVPVNNSQHKLIRFSDSFDIAAWQGATAKHSFAPLASWEKFLTEAPRELIVVHFHYTKQATQKLRKEQGMRLTHLAVDDTYKSGCVPEKGFSDKLQYLTSQHNFTVVRDVCFNFNDGDELTLYQFNRHLFGEFAPKQVTVLMEEWRGLNQEVNGKRVVVYDACWTELPVLSLQYSRPSQRLLCDASRYKHKYLRYSYIAVIVRTEKILLMDDRNLVMTCLNKTLELWRQTKKTTGIHLTFVSMDIGKYGSLGMRLSTQNNTYEEFFRQIYGPDASVKKWEDTFESVTNIHDAGYIASLQKTLVAKAQCIVFVGGGSFQKHTKYLYERLNPDKKKRCIQVVQKCSRNLKP